MEATALSIESDTLRMRASSKQNGKSLSCIDSWTLSAVRAAAVNALARGIRKDVFRSFVETSAATARAAAGVARSEGSSGTQARNRARAAEIERERELQIASKIG
jgi:hypothetical protein